MSSNPLLAAAALAVVVLMLASLWKIFTKAGEAGWKCLVPIFGGVVFSLIVGRPWWWLVLLAIPFVNVVPALRPRPRVRERRRLRFRPPPARPGVRDGAGLRRRAVRGPSAWRDRPPARSLSRK